MDSTLRFLHCRLSPTLTSRGQSSLRLGLPFRVSPVHHRKRCDLPQQSPYRPPLPRFCPLQRFSSEVEPHIPDDSHLAGYVAPSRFLAPSTLCSPPSLSSLFHPDPALGVHPSRLCSSRDAVRPRRRRLPHGVPTPLPQKRGPPLQGWFTSPEARTERLGFSQDLPSYASLGLTSRGFLLRVAGEPVTCPPLAPLSRFVAAAFTLTSTPSPQGFHHSKRSRSLSRPTQPPQVSSPRG
jgi:hypothetical protein